MAPRQSGEEWPPDARTRRRDAHQHRTPTPCCGRWRTRNRRQIIRLIQDTELPAGQIATHFTLTQQAVSQHLTVLKRAGLLDERRDGTRRLYRFQPAALDTGARLLDEFWPDALERLKRVVERDHPKKGAKEQ